MNKNEKVELGSDEYIFTELPNSWQETRDIEASEIDFGNYYAHIKLPDGWYAIPLDSNYGEILLRRHQLLKEFDDKVCQYVRRMEEEEEWRKMCSHETYVISDGYEVCKSCYHVEKIEGKRCSHEECVIDKGYRICVNCWLRERDPTQYIPDEGYEDRVLFKEEEETDKLHEKMKDIFESLIPKLSCPTITIGNSLDRLFEVCSPMFYRKTRRWRMGRENVFFGFLPDRRDYARR